MQIDRVYTKVGDRGDTRLSCGTKVSKGELRVEAYGTVDETNAHIGLTRDLLSTVSLPSDSLTSFLVEVQRDLFNLGAELSADDETVQKKLQSLDKQAISKLELEMDALNGQLEPLSSFVLPGGSPLISQAHITRTVCRRAERVCVRLSQVQAVRAEILVYLNRLSDFFFVLSRSLAKSQGVEETLWRP